MAKPASTEQDYLSDDSEDIVENDSDDEYDDNEYCICRGKDDGTFMICCDACNEWYHGRCVHITPRKAKELDKWICDFCIKKVPKPWIQPGSMKSSADDSQTRGVPSGVGERRTPSPLSTQPVTSKTESIVTSDTQQTRKRSLQSAIVSPEPATKKSKPNSPPETQSRKTIPTTTSRPSPGTEAEKIKKVREQAVNSLFEVLDKAYKEALLTQQKKKETPPKESNEPTLSTATEKDTPATATETSPSEGKVDEPERMTSSSNEQKTNDVSTDKRKIDTTESKEMSSTQMPTPTPTPTPTQTQTQSLSSESQTEQSEDIPTSIDVRALAVAIEEEMWRYATIQSASNIGRSSSSDLYREKFFTLMKNLPRNGELCRNILRSLITPQQLIAMDSVQLATRELLNYRQQRERYLPVKETEPINLPLVKPSLTTETELLIAAATTPSSPPPNTTSSTSLSTSASASSSTSTPRPPSPQSSTLSSKVSNDATKELLSSLESREGEVARDHPHESSAADIDIDLKFNAQDLSAPVFSSTQNTLSTAATASSGDNTTKDKGPKEQSTTGKDDKLHLGAPCWTGVLKYPGVITQLNLKAHHIHGPEMFSQLPSILTIDGRMELKKLFDYLPQIDVSSSRRRTAVLFVPDTTPSSTSSSSSSSSVASSSTTTSSSLSSTSPNLTSSSTPVDNVASYQALYRHLKNLDRGGVLKFEPQPNIDPEVFRELYLFPVCPSEFVPEFLRDDYLNNNNAINIQSLEGEYLFGVLLTKKPQVRSALPTSPSNASTSTTPLGNVVPNLAPATTALPMTTNIDPITTNVNAMFASNWGTQSLASLLASVASQTPQTQTSSLIRGVLTATSPTPSISPIASQSSVPYGSAPVGSLYQQYPLSVLSIPQSTASGGATVSPMNINFQTPSSPLAPYAGTNQPYSSSNLPSYTSPMPSSYRSQPSHGRPY
jgi:hypothetical protein